VVCNSVGSAVPYATWKIEDPLLNENFPKIQKVGAVIKNEKRRRCLVFSPHLRCDYFCG
jgi:hypothetical protein